MPLHPHTPIGYWFDGVAGDVVEGVLDCGGGVTTGAELYPYPFIIPPYPLRDVPVGTEFAEPDVPIRPPV